MTFVKAYLGDTPLFQESTPVPVVGMPLLKTGQTTSYATGDDGDIEAGRAVDFVTLTANNPFGNTNRFTAPDGSQTYTNSIVIDWSTFDGSNVLGYYRGDIATNRGWDSAVAWGVGLNIAGFTGWRLTNVRELANIINFGGGETLNYSPINGPTNVNVWTSTMWPNDSTLAMRLNSGNGGISPASRSGGIARTIACRTFTVTGTTLT